MGKANVEAIARAGRTAWRRVFGVADTPRAARRHHDVGVQLDTPSSTTQTRKERASATGGDQWTSASRAWWDACARRAPSDRRPLRREPIATANAAARRAAALGCEGKGAIIPRRWSSRTMFLPRRGGGGALRAKLIDEKEEAAKERALSRRRPPDRRASIRMPRNSAKVEHLGALATRDPGEIRVSGQELLKSYGTPCRGRGSTRSRRRPA